MRTQAKLLAMVLAWFLVTNSCLPFEVSSIQSMAGAVVARAEDGSNLESSQPEALPPEEPQAEVTAEPETPAPEATVEAEATAEPSETLPPEPGEEAEATAEPPEPLPTDSVMIADAASPEDGALVAKAVKVTKITLTPAAATLEVGDTLQPAVAIEPPEASGVALKWTSSGKSVAAVGADGLVTALKAGSATITAEAQDGSKKKATLKVTVVVLAESIALPDTARVIAGGKLALTALFTPSNATMKALDWASEDPSIAQVSASGVVTAAAVTEAKTVKITAATKDGTGLTAECLVTVVPKAMGVAILVGDDPAAAATIDFGVANTLQLTAKAEPADAGQEVTWATSDKKIATVSADGLVTALKTGNATITATVKDGTKKKVGLKLTVAVLAKSIGLPETSRVISGGKLTLSPVFTPSNATNKGIVWVSENPSTAAVSSSGVVTAAAVTEAKTVKITASTKDGSNLSAECAVTVVPKASGVTIFADGDPANAATVDFGVENTLQLAAGIAPADAGQGVTWATSDKKIATVSADGLVTALKAGSVTITATAADGSKKAASLKLTVAVLAKSIELPDTARVFAGGKLTLSPVFTPSNTTNKRIVWTSADPGVATVSTSGVLTAANVSAEATAKITATTKDGSGLTAECLVTVVPKAASVSILADGAPSIAGTIDLGSESTLQLAAEIAPADAGQNVTWATSDKKIATVSADGLVTGLKVGGATITATAVDGSKKAASFKLTVAVLAQSVQLPESARVIAGRKLTLTLSFTPSNVTQKALDWASGDSTVATVSSAGVVTAAAVTETKTVTISASTKDGSGLKAECLVTVVPKATGVSVLLNGEPASAATAYMDDSGNPLTLAAEVTPEDAGQDVTWSSSDKKIATVSATGVVKGVKVGNVTIKATAADGSGKTGGILVTVKAGAALKVPVLHGSVKADTLLLGKAEVGFLGRVWYEPGSVVAGEDAAWSIQRLSGDEEAAKVELMNASDNEVSLFFSNVLNEGSVTYRVTCTVAGDAQRSAHFDVPLTVTGTVPEDLPEDIQSLTTTVNLDVGETYHFSKSDIVNQDGEALPAYMNLAYDVPASVEDSVVWDDTGMNITFDKPGRFTVTAIARAYNVGFAAPILVKVGGDDATGTISLYGNLMTTLYADGWPDWYLGEVSANNLTLLEGEEVHWTLERTSGSEAMKLELGEYDAEADSVGVLVKEISPVEEEETAQYTVRCYVSDRYQGEYTFEMTLKPALPEGLPSEVRYAGGDVRIPVGGSVTVRFSDITGVDAPLPAGTVFDVDFDVVPGTSFYWGKDARIFTFDKAGRYLLTPSALYGNSSWHAQTIAVTVGSGVSEDFDLQTWARTNQVFLEGGNESGFFGGAYVNGVNMRDGEEATWTLIPDDPEEEMPVKLFISGSDNTNVSLDYDDIRALGESGYTLRYSALDGLYEDEAHIDVKVVEKPENAPDGASYTPTSLSLTAGDTYTFREDEIQLTGGTLDDSVTSWHEFWPSDNIWDHCDYNEIGDGVIQVTFRDPGRYVMTAAGGYGSCEFIQEIPVLVKPEDASPFQLTVNQRSGVLYADANDLLSYVADIDVDNFQPVEGEEYHWSIERTDSNGGNPITLDIDGTSATSAIVNYAFGSGSGSVVYRVTYAVGEGDDAYTASADVPVTMVGKMPANMPKGIETPFDETYDLTVGDSITFDPGEIEFAQDGVVPEGLEIWRQVWTEEGNWDDVEQNRDEDPVCTYTFNEPGRYLFRAAIGVANNMYVQWIDVRVRDEDGGIMNPEVYRRCTVLFENGENYPFLGWVDVGVLLREGEDWDWSMEQISAGTPPVEIYPDDEESTITHLYGRLNGGTGTATFRLHYGAADGLYEGSWDFTVTVLPAADMDGLPEALVMPHDAHYDLTVGDTLTLDSEEIQFTGGTIPQSLEDQCWREFDDDVDQWEGVDYSEDGTCRFYTFHNPGTYIIKARAGVANHILESQVEVVVSESD